MRFLALICWLLLGHAAYADTPSFPPLTGRVVDEAHLLSTQTKRTLEQTLADYENGTTNQVVVATIPSLGGHTIEDYGYQLGRHWGIGQKDKNNGVLLIVAPKDRKVRIEVGYGLEPVLTDALSSTIIQGVILPAFRSGDMEKGVVDGTQAILSVLGGKGMPSHASADPLTITQAFLTIGLMFLFLFISIRHPFLAAFLLSQPSRYGSSSLGGSDWGSSFSGGGGSFGGGGSSGGW